MDPGSSALLAAAVLGGAGAVAGCARRTARAAAPLLALTTALLVAAEVRFAIAVLRVDGRFVEVADTASRATPWWYRLSGLWGGSRSSMLTFTAFVAVTLLAACRAAGGSPRLAAGAAALTASLAAALLATADPFQRLAIPAIDGGGLAPILRHPAMLVHPPLLYLGLVLCVAAGLLALDAAAAPTARVVLLAGWSVLALALVLGSWWAYAELGWGGVWGWDPVENAGLVPWLAATAAVHRWHADGPVPGRAASALAVLAGWTALAGTALTRSGVGSSVHAFSDSRDLGQALGGVLVVLAVASVVALAAPSAAHRTRPRTRPPRLADAGAAVALVAGAVVALGVAVPVVADLAGDDPRSVGGSYFSGALLPVALAGALLAGLAGRPSRGRTTGAGLVGLATAGAALPGLGPAAAALLAVSAGAAVLLLRGRSTARTTAPTALAHLGLLALLAGVAVSSTGGDALAGLRPGQSVTVDGFAVRYAGVAAVPAAGRTRVVADVELSRGGRRVARLRPSLDRWTGVVAPLAETKTATWRGVDVQVVLRRALRDASAPESSVLLEVHVRPLVGLVWWGGALLAAGAGWAGLRRARQLASAPPAPPAPPVPLAPLAPLAPSSAASLRARLADSSDDTVPVPDT